MFFIYKITNLVNGKNYIGQTRQSVDKRFKAHKQTKQAYCRKLVNAFNKYGRDNFSVELLTVCHTQEIANYWECYFISLLGAIVSGYNIRNGGSRSELSTETKSIMSRNRKKRGGTRLGVRVLDSTREKLSISAKKRSLTQEGKDHFNHLSEYIRINGSSMRGKTHSDEAKRKISEKNTKTTAAQLLGIIQDLKSGQFTQTELVKKYKLSKSNISRIKIRYVSGK